MASILSTAFLNTFKLQTIHWYIIMKLLKDSNITSLLEEWSDAMALASI
jgi:hypothetical protein